MKKAILVIVLLCMASATLLAQKETSHWFFGENVGLHFTDAGVVPIGGGQAMYNEGVSSISDPKGNLLFYCDGETVWNKAHQKMANGTGLLGHYSATQGSIIVPHPGECDQFYVFTLDAKEHASANGLQYHLVDMELQGGMGEVVSKNNFLYAPALEKMAAVRHSDGQSVWVVTHEMQTNIFRSYLVTAAGVDSVAVLSAIGLVPSTIQSLGQMKISTDGKRLAVAYLYPENVEVFDFDVETGKVSNLILIPETVFEVSSLYGLEFSPDGNLLYVANHSIDYLNESGNLYQFDLGAGSEADIINSAVLVGQNTPPTDMRGLQLGLDGRLYVSRSLGKYLGVVQHPNSPGLACNYVDEGLDLADRIAGWTLPSFMVSYFEKSMQDSLEAGFSFENDCLEDATQFFAKEDGADTRYRWDFEDGDTSSLRDPVHIFKDTGSYEVSLVVSKRCVSDTASAVVSIKSCYKEVYVPTAFSPNGDGINDVFQVYGKGIAQFDLSVYDRWGERVFESKQQGIGWDGSFNGKPMGIGIYVYRLSVTFAGGAASDLTGSITLLR